MKPLQIQDVALQVDPRSPYGVREACTHRLVTLDHTLSFADVERECKSFAVHPAALPFGLLESVVVGTAADGDGFQYCVLLSKDTGQRKSAWTPPGVPVPCVHHDMAVDDDARHPDIGAVFDATGHDMRFRMFAAAAIANITIALRGTVPAALTLVFHGANAVPVDMALEDAVAATAAKAPVKFLLGPIRPKDRLSGAVRAMNEPR